MRLQAYGVGIDAPPRWEVRIGRRPVDPEQPAGRPRPVLHAATVPLPEIRGDFGGGVTALLGPQDAFFSLFEYEPQAADTALFRGRSRPQVAAPDLQPSQLQRTIPGQSGVQYFFVENGRPFCLYVVVGSHARRAVLVQLVNAALDTVSIEPGVRA